MDTVGRARALRWSLAAAVLAGVAAAGWWVLTSGDGPLASRATSGSVEERDAAGGSTAAAAAKRARRARFVSLVRDLGRSAPPPVVLAGTVRR